MRDIRNRPLRFTNFVLLFLIFNVMFVNNFITSAEAQVAPNLFAYSSKTIDGKDIPFNSYRGKVLLLVNTASKCGFTPQYKDLESLYERYKDKNFLVLAFPSNDFGEQEPGSNDEIKKFCSSAYGVTFPIFERSVVNGPAKTSLFKFLTEESEEKMRGEVTWNFEKFLIDREGIVRERYGSQVNPLNRRITERLETILAEKE